MEFNIYLISAELLILFFFGICFKHAIKTNLANVFQLVTGSIFGVLLELATIYQLNAYHYGKFLIMIGNVPLIIGMAWGVIIYVVRLNSQKIDLPIFIRPVLDAFYALSIDLVMDAIAIRVGFWDWGHGLKYQYFGVPYNNFWAWFWVVYTYSSGIQLFTIWFSKNTRATSSIQNNFIISLGSLFTGLLGVLTTNAFIVFVIPDSMKPIVISITLTIAFIYLIYHRPQLSHLNIDSIGFWIPLGFHAYYIGVGIISGVLFNPTILLWISIVILLISLYVHRNYFLKMTVRKGYPISDSDK